MEKSAATARKATTPKNQTTKAKAGTGRKTIKAAAQSDGGLGRQGETPIAIGGLKQVPISMRTVPDTSLRARVLVAEDYPFGELLPAKKMKTATGSDIVGPSFFIPDSDAPSKHIAKARKRHKDKKFWVRKAFEKLGGKAKGTSVPGVLVFRAGEEIAPTK